FTWAVVVMLTASAAAPAQAVPPKNQCESARLKAAGAYADCQQGTLALLETKGTSIVFLKSASRCRVKYAEKWQQLQRQFPGTPCAAERFVDNGDGTVTDNLTGLECEKKRKLDGASNAANPHDADNQYVWSATGDAADGTAYADFLPALNDGCFAG